MSFDETMALQLMDAKMGAGVQTKLYTCSKCGHKFIHSEDFATQVEVDSWCSHCTYIRLFGTPEERAAKRAKNKARHMKRAEKLEEELASQEKCSYKLGKLRRNQRCKECGWSLQKGEELPYVLEQFGFGRGMIRRNYFCCPLHVKIHDIASSLRIFRMAQATKSEREGIWLAWRREWIMESIETGIQAFFTVTDYEQRIGHSPVWYREERAGGKLQ